jgi:DNA transposition AAA+ family ATPase
MIPHCQTPSEISPKHKHPMTQPTTLAALPASSNGGSLAIAAHDFEQVLSTKYDPDAQAVLRFWYFTAKEHQWNLARLAKVTGISTTTLFRLFRGEYQADSKSSVTKLLRAQENFRESSDNPDFIETSLAKRLFVIFDKTRALKNVSILWGKMGIGKTECINEYVRLNNHGRTVAVRFPAGANFTYFITTIARSIGVARTQSITSQREKIIQVLSAGQRLLIIDELHQAFLTTRTDTAVKCCEFLREISDLAACGLVLVGTEVLHQAVFHGPHKEALLQLVDRGTVQVPLPPAATQSDYRKFLQAYGLDFPDPAADPDATSILNAIIKSHGLRKLTLHLRDGAAYASKRDEEYTWHHFAAAFAAIQSLSK